ncbi:hypothetical protein WR25_20837 isoform B [Diploscapter pachys]|nr:hypothetical protein WR25_20837 isoform B [Diploscapter pachys]
MTIATSPKSEKDLDFSFPEEDINRNEKKIDKIDEFNERETPWNSVWICIIMQFVVGCQVSIYFMSMWPYLQGLDPTANLDFLGWIVAACCIGQSIANPIFGFWNQRTLSVTQPIICGFILAGIGQFLFGIISVFPSNRRWWMMGARFLTGLGVGNIAVMRSYIATASVAKDRLRAVSFGTAGYVTGVMCGPAIQAVFTPIGENGFKLWIFEFNMYTIPAFLMVILSFVACAVTLTSFTVNYAGIMEDEDSNSSKIVPKYDLLPAIVCIYLFVSCCMIGTNIEVISTPVSTVMYDWKDSKSILLNGIFESLGCVVSLVGNVAIGYTRVGKIDKRLQILFGLSLFLLYHIFNYPWPFYSGPLHFLPPGENTTIDHGGCLPSYTWCNDTVRVPLPLYIFCFIFLYGFAFPFVGSPAGALFSEILGPIRQGWMQGMYSLGGSFAQFAAPILAT